jgi:hypothetical protein
MWQRSQVSFVVSRNCLRKIAMKNMNVVVARPVKVVVNGAVSGDKWGKIVDAQTGQTLHTGQIKYVKRVALAKYNALVR